MEQFNNIEKNSASVIIGTNCKTNSKSGLVWYYEVSSVLSICYSCLSCGTFLGFTSTAVPSMEMVSFNGTITENDISMLGGLGPFGAIIGSFLALLPIRYLGTRKTIAFTSFPATLASWIILGFASNFSLIFLARVLGGIGCGICISCAPLYVIDISSAEHRGRLGTMPQLFIVIGVLISYILGSFMNWRNLAFACSLITLPGAILLFVSPDSPQWLMSKDSSGSIINNNNDNQTALQILKKLHGLRKADEIMKQIRLNFEQNRLPNKCQRLNSVAWKRFCICLGIIGILQLTGINGVNFFALEILNRSFSSDDPHCHTSSIILATTQLIATLMSSVYIDKYGRKFLLTASTLTLSISGCTLRIYFYLSDHGILPLVTSYLSWFPLLALVTFVFGFAIGLGPVSWILVAEILPMDSRHWMNPLVTALYWFCAFLITSSFPWLVSGVKLYGVFCIYSTVAVLGVYFFRVAILETKGRSEDEIQMYFNHGH